MVDLILNPLESNPGWSLVKFLYHYYGLRDYFSFRYNEEFHPEKILEIPAYDNDNKQGDGKFWGYVLSGQIIKGQKIRLLNFQISPWFPRKPGQFWTYEAAIARDRAFDNHVESRNAHGVILDLYGKTLMTEIGGKGTVNFGKERDWVLITATSSGNTEEGIPILCRKDIWLEIESEFTKGRNLEVDIQGQLVNLTNDSNSFLLRAPSIPKVAIWVNSLLNIKLKATALSIKVTPWTTFKTKSHITPYGFTYVGHQMFRDTVEESTQWIKSYVENHNGTAILTDFDESLHSLNAIFPLNDVATGSIVDADMLQYCQQILNDFRGRGG